MIEPLMFVGIGFIAAALLVLGIIPLVHGRAVRLTMRRLEALTPLSMAEIQADKDQLRAEFAMSTRRLEMSVEQMKAKTTSQLAEIGKKSEAIGRLKLELGEKTAALFALEAKEKQLADELGSARNELSGKSTGLDETERTLAATQAELAQITGNFHESSVTADSQRVELVALRAQTEALKGQIEAFELETSDLRERLAHKTAELESITSQLADEHAKSDQFGNRVGELDRALIAQTTESEVLARRVEELNSRLDEQGRFLADREFVSDRLRSEATSAQNTETQIRAELADAESRHRLATEAIRTEKALVEEQLPQSQEERAKLQREIAGMKRDAESAWASERMENAVLRERINDVAAEVARLTATLEGPTSPIDAILNSEARPVVAVNGTPGGGAPSIAPSGGEGKGTLADRIRALQGRASRVPQTSGA
jgi:DNA repair exonuclease SbcCD ATPase subunit